MRWLTRDGYLIEETVVMSNRDRPARVLRVTREGRTVEQYASWADLIVNVDVQQMTQVE